ncbi:ribosomal-processing cysteine protease Prp [Anaerobacillus alkaliphilus]|uniref:Ribosomal processing cysteine protease Prp n=1 Tax=Anaerobacillus alkaliphilus TaxID=1548597 RepID=A0A4Q0VSJ3_9BACI|nr:ribosomal-processing cysteine protease Prp [Anaerobacillus alkaliphilus]RXI98390.1 ribosomal-processing cysteine protease Prp [Anaerobacillus alkaliphilus]
MIKVKVVRNIDNTIRSFEMSGHAEAGPYGQDIVCAGASAVSIGTVNAIDTLCNVQLEVEQNADGGFLRCTVPTGLDRQRYEKVQLILEAMVVSLNSIAEGYGKYITIRET